VDDGGIGEAAEFVDEIAYRDDVGMGDCLVMTLTHDFYSFTLLTGTE
jgi:hypothetical protein